MKYYQKNIDEIIKEFNTSKEGLNEKQVHEKIDTYGKNILPSGKKENLIVIFLNQFKNPMTIILIVTVILSFLVNEVLDAVALMFIILVDVVLGTYEEWKARKDAESLLNMIKVKSIVIRNGEKEEILAEDIVVGDILVLESGMKISADARIIESHNFQVNESSLTGESIGVHKNSEIIEKDVALALRKNMVYAGTSVITGRALAVVTATSINTEIGKIADKVTNTEEEKSPLTIRIEKFSKQISCLILIVAIVVAFVLKMKDFPMHEIFLSVIALAVSAMPEGLSLALTMALTVASNRMSKKNVIIKKLNSVEALGSCTVIASDKTGTLTVNEQTAKMIVLKDGSKYTVSGSGYNGTGEVSSTNGASITKAVDIAYLGAINNEATLEYENQKWESFGDSIDIAFLSLAYKLNITDKVKNTNVIERIPYESENQYSAVFYEKDNELYCTVKGSLEKIMSFSEQNQLYQEQNEELTKNGYRVIALATGKVNGTTEEDIKNLEFIGLVAFIDPIREDAKLSIQECKNAGIKVLMITGDHPLTAYAIAKDLELCETSDQVATGDDLDKYRDLGQEAFDEFITKIKVFSRVTPIDKLDIVNSLKRQGEFVAVTGDGVNDAPAIKTANVGIAMGSGTDVAKDTASMIVIDDRFTSIVEGVKEGRCAYSNIRKITLFLLGCGFAEVAFFLLSILFGYDMPLVAIQLLWINMVTDGLQDAALSFEKAESYIMKERPRDTKESIFTRDLMIEVLILGLTITVAVFGIWKYMMDKNMDITYARAVIMMFMVFIQNINVLNCRSEKRSVFKSNVFANPFVNVAIIGSILLQIVLAELPITASFLKITPIPLTVIFKLFALSFIIIIVFEIYKLIYHKVKKSQV